MMDNSEPILPFTSLPHLSLDERDDAAFRGKDLAWACLAGRYDDLAAKDRTLSYQALGNRIGRTRAQVQRWMDSPHNMTLKSLSLLAEGLDADLCIELRSRAYATLANRCHPAESAKADLPLQEFKARLYAVHLLDPANQGLLNSRDVNFSWLDQELPSDTSKTTENHLPKHFVPVADNVISPASTGSE